MSRARKFADLAGSADAGSLTGRNIIINGAMQVAQRGTSETGVGGSAGYFTVDRFDMYFNGTAGRLTQSQADVTDLAGFQHALKLDCTTADTSIAADEVAILQYAIEGQDLQQFKKGYSDAESFTVSFYVKGNASATYTIELQDNDNSRQNTQTFDVTTSWTRVTKTFAADTTGKFDNDNAASLRIQIYLQAGSTYTSGTFTSNTWATLTNANTVKSDQTMFFDSTNRELFITGLQLEVGEKATPFEHRSYADELVRCQRYFEVIKWNHYPLAGYAYNTAQFALSQQQFTAKRANPSLTFPTIGTSSGTVGLTKSTGGFVTQGSTLRAVITTTMASIYNNVADGFSGFTDDDVVMLYSYGETELKVDAEL